MPGISHVASPQQLQLLRDFLGRFVSQGGQENGSGIEYPRSWHLFHEEGDTIVQDA